MEELDDSEQSDSEVILDGGEFDEAEAARYWHHRRTQAVRGPGRTVFSSRNRTSSGTSHGQSCRPDQSVKRRPAPEPVTSSELPPGTEMVYKTGFTKTGSGSTHRIPPATGSVKSKFFVPSPLFASLVFPIPQIFDLMTRFKKREAINSIYPAKRTHTYSVD